MRPQTELRGFVDPDPFPEALSAKAPKPQHWRHAGGWSGWECFVLLLSWATRNNHRR
jgi:hypothetical protein